MCAGAYTPRVLTEPIVQYTLEPLVYIGPAEGLPKSEWKLKSAKELLALKICDMACGSGAFLVQACRYLAERLLEAWANEERGALDVDREAKGNEDGVAVVSGTGSLEDSDGSGDGLLSSDEAIPERRAVRDDKSDSQSSGIDSGEHRRRSGARSHEGVSELSQHCTGVPDGVTDTSDTRAASESAERYRSATAADSLRTNQSDDLQASAGTGEEGGPGHVNRDPLYRSTDHASRSTIRPRITPHGSRSTGAHNESLIPDDPQERKLYAMRLIAQRCLYGVDINPLAVEMCKLSLWLLTMAKDKPFEFLDHNIRCGDSLVGLHNLDQLRHFSLKPESQDSVLFGGPFEEAVEEAISLRLRLEEMPSNTIDDVRAQEKLLREADEKIARLRCAADLLVAAEFYGENAKDKQERVRHAAVKSGYYIERGPTEEFQRVASEAWRVESNNPSLSTPNAELRRFHWPLEFPEVIVKRGGFDAFIGNPPFMGGQRITGSLGTAYRTFLIDVLANGQRGSSDLCAYFFLKCMNCLRRPSFLGLLATNTIAQGDTRDVGLAQLVESGCAIPRAISSRRWPGVASLEVSHVWLMKGIWNGTFVLDDQEVSSISAFLTPMESTHGDPKKLSANDGVCFQGCNILGDGFFLNETEAAELIECEASSCSVIRPCLNGEQLNSSPTLSSSRKVINFFDWPLDRTSASNGWKGPVAADFPKCLDVIRWNVKPARDQITYSRRAKDYWWQYERNRPELYEAIVDLKRVLVVAATSQTLAFAFTGTDVVWTHALYVIALDRFASFATLQSSLHESWARYYGSSMKGDLRYTPTSTFEPFPFCDLNDEMERLGKDFYELRAKVMLARKDGLTRTYNRFHDPNERSAEFQKLRDLHVEMDQAVAAAYGWGDLDLGHGFHETKQGIRFTISEAARREVLQRLLKLNHERYAEEVKQGLHKKGKGASGAGRGKKKAVAASDTTADAVPKPKRRATKKPTKSSDAQHVAEDRTLFDTEEDE